MKKTVWMFALILASSISSIAFAQSEMGGSCSYPDRPAIADGATATEAQMLDSQKAMKEYLALGTEFLACIDKEEAALSKKTDITPEQLAEQKARLTQTYNAVVDDMNSVAELFNRALKAFKAKG